MKVELMKAVVHYEGKWNYNDACTVKLYDMEVNNSLLKPDTKKSRITPFAFLFTRKL